MNLYSADVDNEHVLYKFFIKNIEKRGLNYEYRGIASHGGSDL